MSGKNMRILRRGSEKHHLPLNAIKSAFNGLTSKEKAEFLKVAKMDVYE